MKRKGSTVIAAAALAAAIPLQKEAPEAECKDRSCVNELTATLPDQPHGLEEATSHEPVDYIVVMSSPPDTMRRTPENIEWARKRGLEWTEATPQEANWMRAHE
jgi:hypothetical protein